MKQAKKRALGIFMATMMLLSSAPSALAAESDIQGHWAQQALQSFVDNGYLAGDGEGHYTPNNVMTRAQFAALMNRVVGLTEESSAITGYTDVAASDWYYHDMAKALAAGYMNGTSQTTMSPNAPITRQQAFTMLARYLGLDSSKDDALDGFVDENAVAEYARGPLAAMVTGGYVTGTDDKKLNPEQQLTRAEGVTVLYRAITALKSANSTAASTSGLKDGVYTGTGAGYGGTLKVQMTVSGGKITKLEIVSHSETNAYLNRAKTILDSILEKQGTDGVDTVSGATLSSRGILTAVNACISQAKGGTDTSTTGAAGGGGGGGGNSTKTDGKEYASLKDGTYEGSAKGYSGTTKVKVTVSDGKISAVEIVSHGDTLSYFSRARSVINSVLSKQSTDVDAVTNATYSSWGILNAINDALKDAKDEAEEDEPATIEVSTWEALGEALAMAKDGDTIQLTADITDAGQIDTVASATVSINKAVTIDGNGKTISAYKDGKVTKNTLDAAGTVTASEQVDATFCFEVTEASVQIQDLTIDGASFSSKLGGAMYVETGADLALNHVTFKNCRAGSTGAGNGGAAIYVEPHRGTSPTVTATNCTFENNIVNDGTTGRGGAVYGYNANITLDGCTFTGNKAGFGGAVAAAGTTTLTVKNCTFDASNDASYGGDDIYVFDGYTFYKKTMAADSAVTAVLSGNTHAEDGTDFKSYRVVCGRVLGDVSDTTNAASAISKTCLGNGDVFLCGHDLTFDNAANYDRKEAPTKETTSADYAYLLVNIPYAEFYKADLNNTVEVDAFTSATKTKTRTGTLAGGSYHLDDTGAAITGVTFPVVMSKTDFANFKTGKTEITDDNVVEITATNRGTTTTTRYTGREALFESGSYSYYVLSTAPAYYKVASVAADGTASFCSVKGAATALSDVKVSLQTETTYGDYQLNLMDDSNTISGSSTVYGVILHTKEGSDYGLRHLENIWRGTELAFCTGFTEKVHNCPTSSAHYQAIMGQTITQITYLTKNGIYTIDCNVYVPIKVASALTVTAPEADAKSASVTLPEGVSAYKAAYAVMNADGEDVTAACGFACNGTALTWTGTPTPGAYKLALTDGNGVYAPLYGSFTISTAAAAAQYDDSMLALKAADGVSAEAFQSYLAGITKVTVDGTGYAVSGRNAVQVINSNGFLDLTAKSGKAYVFADLAKGKTYTVTVASVGYPDMTFTVTVPETIYAYASLSYAEYWAAEQVYLSGEDMTAGNTTDADRIYTQGKNTYEEYDKGAFDAVTRATTNHGLHRGSFQQTVTIETASGKTYQPLYWEDSSSFVNAADGQTYSKSDIGMTQYEITGIKYVPVAVVAEDYQAFCAAYAVTQNGEALQGGYTEGKLKGYEETACVTAQTNGLKAASLNEGAWSFGARQAGEGSGLLGQNQQTAANVQTAVQAESQFGDFLRADITGDGYGALGSRMQTVVWQYYGDGNDVLATYGTKFAADNWMHKANGIQLGLTDSLRCQLPGETDGTGKWVVTVYALGYADYSFEINVTANDIHGANSPMTPDQKTRLSALAEQAKALLDSEDGKAGVAAKEDKWVVLSEHYEEASALLAAEDAAYGAASDLLAELPDLIGAVQPASSGE